MGYRSMQPERAVTLINSLFEDYGDRSTEYFCVDNILPKNWPTEVLPQLKTPPGSRSRNSGYQTSSS
jgi:magnesium-protoporphyrin IX monomethyl ester (oxidative) cyclase